MRKQNKNQPFLDLKIWNLTWSWQKGWRGRNGKKGVWVEIEKKSRAQNSWLTLKLWWRHWVHVGAPGRASGWRRRRRRASLEESFLLGHQSTRDIVPRRTQQWRTNTFIDTEFTLTSRSRDVGIERRYLVQPKCTGARVCAALCVYTDRTPDTA